MQDNIRLIVCAGIGIGDRVNDGLSRRVRHASGVVWGFADGHIIAGAEGVDIFIAVVVRRVIPIVWFLVHNDDIVWQLSVIRSTAGKVAGNGYSQGNGSVGPACQAAQVVGADLAGGNICRRVTVQATEPPE